MTGFSQIPSNQWVPQDLRPVATMAAPFAPWATRLNAVFEDYEQDGLGPAKGAGFKTDSGLLFYIEYLEFASPNHSVCIYLVFKTDYSAALKEVMQATGITGAELTWIDYPRVQLL